MLKESVKYSIFFFFAFLLPIGNVFAVDNFYAKLSIKEQKVSGTVRFSLTKAEALYGDYENSYFIDNPNKDKAIINYDYILEAYDAKKALLAKYDLNSSRYAYWDGAGTGGVIENNEGTISAVIPFDRNNPASFIKVDNQGKTTDFIVLPVSQLEEEFKKIPLCKKDGEKPDLKNNERCCSGLMPAMQKDYSYICTDCGNGKCSKYENEMTCAEDCTKVTVSPAPQSSKSTVKDIAFYAGIIFSALTIIGLIAFLAIWMKNKNK